MFSFVQRFASTKMASNESDSLQEQTDKIQGHMVQKLATVKCGIDPESKRYNESVDMNKQAGYVQAATSAVPFHLSRYQTEDFPIRSLQKQNKNNQKHEELKLVTPNNPEIAKSKRYNGAAHKDISELSIAKASITTAPACGSRLQREQYTTHSLSDMICTKMNDGDLVTAMCQLTRSDKMVAVGDLEEVLRAREQTYGTCLDPTWFTHGTDLGFKAKSIGERNLARAMLVGGPLMVAQRGAQKLRKIMLKGDSRVLETMKLAEPTTLARVLKQLENVPPLALLKLCNKEVGNSVTANLLQHSDDLDFIQEVLNAVGSHSQLTPTLHAVLAGFNRRRNLGSFKHAQQSFAMDRLRFSHLGSANDNDHSNSHKVKQRVRSAGLRVICQYFQKNKGCRNVQGCRYQHNCIICGAKSHGASGCKVRKRREDSSRGRSDLGHAATRQRRGR